MSNHLESPLSQLPVTGCLKALLCWVINSPPDRIAFTYSNLISQCTERTEAAPVLSETSYHTHSQSLLFHWVNKAQPCQQSPRRRPWCKRTDVFLFCGDPQKVSVKSDGNLSKTKTLMSATNNLQIQMMLLESVLKAIQYNLPDWCWNPAELYPCHIKSLVRWIFHLPSCSILPHNSWIRHWKMYWCPRTWR